MNTIEKLDQLAELESQEDAIKLHYDELRRKAVPDEIRQALDDIAAEEQTALNALSEGILKLRDEIKADVVHGGASVKANHIHAVYNKGRISWNTKGLEGLMVAFPELAKMRKEGNPYVTFRKI